MREWFVGIDWASETHQVCLVDADARLSASAPLHMAGPGWRDVYLAVGDDTGRAGGHCGGHRGATRPIVETLLDRSFRVYAVNPKQTRPLPRTASPSPVLRTTVASPMCSATPCALTGTVFGTWQSRMLSSSSCASGPRMAEDLQQERNRLANRVREQLWRYYRRRSRSATILAPTGSRVWLRCRRRQGRRVRESSIDAFSKPTHPGSRRQRRRRSCASAAYCGGGTVEAASAHIRAVAARLKLVNRQIKEAHRRLDALCGKLRRRREKTASGQEPERRDVTILRSLQVWKDCPRHAVRRGCGASAPARLSRPANPLRVAPVTKRSASAASSSCVQACHMRLRSRSIMGPVLSNTIRSAAAAMPNCASEVTATARPAQRCRPPARGGLRRCSTGRPC